MRQTISNVKNRDRTMKQSLKTLSFIFILAFLSSSLYAQQTTTVVRVVDGDTLWVRYEGQREKLRLIGIDTPESKANKKAKRDAKRSGQDVETIIAMGKRATEYVRSRVKPVEVSDPCGDAGGRGNDIKKITATSDGTDIMFTVELCANAVAYTKYFLHIDYKDPNDLDNDLETNEPDTLIDNNLSCLTTSDVTKMHGIHQQINKDTGPGIIDLVGNVLTYTVSYAELGLTSGDDVLLWVETYYIGMHERAPNTDSSDGCSKQQFSEEVISLTLNAKENNFCEDQDDNMQWEALIQEHPDDMQMHALHALRIGLCFKVDRGGLTVSQATDIFENMISTLISAKERKNQSEDSKK
jgi:hypothetical protein